MPEFRTTRRVRHSAEQMFQLVADIEKYPQFVPLCEDLKIRATTEEGDSTVKHADMTVGYKALRETFTSRVALFEKDLHITVNYIDGPFRILDNQWRFVPVTDTSSDVVFYIKYEFKSRMLGLVMGSMFDTAFRRFAGAFEARANRVYGTGGIAS